MKNTWKTISSKTIYKNHWIEVVEDEVIESNGQDGLYAYVKSAPSVFIIALTEKNDIYLIGQFRYTSGVYSLELPGGGSGNLSFLEAAKKELQEETGLIAKDWIQLGSFFPLNGISSEQTFVFLAKDLDQTHLHKKEEEGIEELRKVPFKQALAMIKQGQITDGQTIASLHLAQLYLQT